MDRLEIDKHDPDKYLEILKESLQQHTNATVKVRPRPNGLNGERGVSPTDHIVRNRISTRNQDQC